MNKWGALFLNEECSIFEEISRMAGKDITDEEKRDALSPILDRVFMKMKNSALEVEEDENLRVVAGSLADYIVKRLKKPLIQNLIDMSKYPELGCYVVILLEPWKKFLRKEGSSDYSQVGDSSENKTR